MKLLPLILAACGSFEVQRLELPASTEARETADAQQAIDFINTGFGCTIVTLTLSSTAVSLGENVVAYAYSEADQDTLFTAGDDGFYQPSANSILLFPAMDLITDGVNVGDNIVVRQTLHELGHLLGLYHVTTAGAIMNPVTVDTPADAAVPEYIEALRGAGVGCQAGR